MIEMMALLCVQQRHGWASKSRSQHHNYGTVHRVTTESISPCRQLPPFSLFFSPAHPRVFCHQINRELHQHHRMINNQYPPRSRPQPTSEWESSESYAASPKQCSASYEAPKQYATSSNAYTERCNHHHTTSRIKTTNQDITNNESRNYDTMNAFNIIPCKT